MNNNNQKLWKDIDWRRVETRIEKVQKRIYKCSLEGKQCAVLMLQNILISSLDAKLLAVRHVTSKSKGKNTAGIDGRRYSTPEAKMSLVCSLSIDGIAAPKRRVWITKPGKPEQRPLGIPILKDRAKQKLVLMALEPEWEARFEPNSYGFRPGRCTKDAIEAIFSMLRNHKGSGQTHKFVLDADLKGCFDNIDHEYLLKKLNTSPLIASQIRAWLKDGIFEGLILNPPYHGIDENKLGTPQGGVISPFLANVALHGLELHMKEWIIRQSWDFNAPHDSYKTNKVKSIGVVRFADDFVIIHKDKNIIIKAKAEVEKWLYSTSKLKFNESKTRIIDSRNGLNFLGFSVININKNADTKVLIYPSKSNQVRFIKSIGDICRNYRAISAFDLIKALRPKVLGWANYYRHCECKKILSRLDMLIYNILRKWVFRRDKRSGRMKVKEKYFPQDRTFIFHGREYKNNWVLCGSAKDKKGKNIETWLPKLVWVKSEKFIKVAGSRSVFDSDELYWNNRNKKYALNAMERLLLEKQKGICTSCKGIIKDDNVEIDHINAKVLGGDDDIANLQLLHRHCHVIKTASDLKKYRTRDNELDEVKVSRPVL